MIAVVGAAVWSLMRANSVSELKSEVTPDLSQAQSEAQAEIPRVTPGTQATNALALALAERRSNVQVQASGRVTRLLSDDKDGSRHQRLIVEVSPGHTVLIAHNIDLAPRVAPLAEGDTIEFFGEYEWNDRGGVVHWTHRDPAGRHVAGWIRKGGEMFH